MLGALGTVEGQRKVRMGRFELDHKRPSILGKHLNLSHSVAGQPVLACLYWSTSEESTGAPLLDGAKVVCPMLGCVPNAPLTLPQVLVTWTAEGWWPTAAAKLSRWSRSFGVVLL